MSVMLLYLMGSHELVVPLVGCSQSLRRLRSYLRFREKDHQRKRFSRHPNNLTMPWPRA